MGYPGGSGPTHPKEEHLSLEASSATATAAQLWSTCSRWLSGHRACCTSNKYAASQSLSLPCSEQDLTPTTVTRERPVLKVTEPETSDISRGGA